MHRQVLTSQYEAIRKRHETLDKAVVSEKLDLLWKCVKARIEQNIPAGTDIFEFNDETIYKMICDASTQCADNEVRLRELSSRHTPKA